jgi:hypothetical protein
MTVLGADELDYDLRCDAVRDANRLRQRLSWLEREAACTFFRALWRARSLREYYLLLDQYESDGEEAVQSILNGSAFISGGLVARLIGQTGPRPETPAELPHPTDSFPSYDPVTRELRLGHILMRRYTKQNFHERILQAFQRNTWEARIRIPRFFTSNPERLREAIDQLNTPQKDKPMLIRFRLDGKYILWERR